MREVVFNKSESGSLFLNNKTQSIRLKRSIRFDNIEQRLVAIKMYNEKADVIYLTEMDIHDNEKWKAFQSFVQKNKEIIKESKDVSMFLNNKTQAVRIPASMAFPMGSREATIEEYFIASKGDISTANQKILKLIVARGQ
jgi:virulence-associated protein VagC